MTVDALWIVAGVSWGLTAVIYAVGHLDRWRPSKPTPAWLEARSGRSVIVHKVDGTSIAGVLIYQGGDGLMLMAARHLDAAATLPGETWIPARTVDFVQIPDLAAPTD